MFKIGKHKIREGRIYNYSWKLFGTVCLRSADVEDGTEVNLGDDDRDEYLSEREAAVYPTPT